MPFYEYTCSNCGRHHEELQKVTDKPLRKCPGCGRNTLSRLMSAPVFRLKGGGWYETDFKSDADSKRNLAGERDDAPKAEAGSESEKKPDAATKEDKAVEKPADKPAVQKPTAKAKPAAKKAAAKPVAKAAARKPASRSKARK